MMRIVYSVLLKDIAGGETVCLQLMRAAHERGHTACILVPGPGSVMEAARREGFEVFIFPLERTFHLRSAWKLAQFLREWQADLVHTHTAVPGMVLARIGAWLANVPILCHIHGSIHYSSKPLIRFLQNTLDNVTTRFCKALIAVSHNTKLSLLATGKQANRIIVVPNGVKLSAPLERPTSHPLKQGIPSNHQLVGCVARLAPTKGQHVLVQAAVEILAAIPDVTFMFVGADLASGGTYEQELRACAEQLGISANTRFVGFQNDAAHLMSLFDVFVLPSQHEAMPMTILEAMAARVPVVATRVNGIPEVVEEGQTGFLVPWNDAHALASALLKLLCDPILSRKMGEAGRQRIEEHFDLDHLHDAVFRLYKQIGNRDG